MNWYPLVTMTVVALCIAGLWTLGRAAFNYARTPDRGPQPTHVRGALPTATWQPDSDDEDGAA